MQIYFRFPDFKTKALTFSYDDGVVQDKKLVEIFNKYKLKATFNINSGLMGEGNRLAKEEIADLYSGHEIAVHTLTHPKMEMLSTADLANEILEDRKNLEKISGNIVQGMAYPFGLTHPYAAQTARACGIRYARATAYTKNFSLPTNPFIWNPTCHHSYEGIFSLIEEFLEPDAKEGDWRVNPKLFYIWGHSYEFDYNVPRNNWKHIEEVCLKLFAKEEVWYATNGEIESYISAYKALRKSVDGKTVFNPTSRKIFFYYNGKNISVNPGQTKKLK